MLHRRERKPNGNGLRLATTLLLIAVGSVGKLCSANAAATRTGHPGLMVKSLPTPAQRYFDAVAPEDRENFIKYHLDKGLEERVPNYRSGTRDDFEFSTFQGNPFPVPCFPYAKLIRVFACRAIDKSPAPNESDAMEPDDFSVNLLDHFMATFGLVEVEVYEFVALNVICFPSGWCFNPDDIGNICCPF